MVAGEALPDDVGFVPEDANGYEAGEQREEDMGREDGEEEKGAGAHEAGHGDGVDGVFGYEVSVKLDEGFHLAEAGFALNGIISTAMVVD